KVRHPRDPDESRGTGPDRTPGKRQMGTSYLTQASNKRSLTLDLKQAAGQDVFKKLVATADVLVENYRPGALDALGLGYETMAAINPRLIYASMSAFGQRGPRAQQTAYDYVIQATSGINARWGSSSASPPRRPGLASTRPRFWPTSATAKPSSSDCAPRTSFKGCAFLGALLRRNIQC